jgi:hypothetical protein
MANAGAAAAYSTQQRSMSLAVACIATAGGYLQATTIHDRDVAAMIFNESPPLQLAGGPRDADAAYAEHEGEEFMGNVEILGIGPILGH